MSSRRPPRARRRIGLAPTVVLFVLLAGGGVHSSGPAAPAPSARPLRVCVLVSQDSGPGQQTLQGLRRTLESRLPGLQLETFDLAGNPAHAAEPLARARQGAFDLILTLGSVATRAASGDSQGLPVVACLVLSPADLHDKANTTAAVLEFPVEVELRWMKKVLPRARHVGILYSPQNNQARIDAAARTAKTMGLVLHPRPVGSPREIPAALESLVREADVLWGVADPVVLTPETAEPILLFSFRSRIPFVGLSQSWAKAGALYALDRDYTDVGAQCGELGAQVLAGQPASSISPAYPRKVVYWINLKTARQMKITLDPELIKGARDAFQ